MVLDVKKKRSNEGVCESNKGNARRSNDKSEERMLRNENI